MEAILTFLAANFYLSLVKFCLCIITMSEVHNLTSLVLQFPNKFQRHYLPYCLKHIIPVNYFKTKI